MDEVRLQQSLRRAKVSAANELRRASARLRRGIEENEAPVAAGGRVPRSLAERFGDALSVKDFGAVGDGEADDTEAFQAAIAASAGILHVPAGIYRIGSLAIDRNVKIVGAGRLRVTLLITSFGTYRGVKYGVLAKGDDASNLAALVQLQGLTVHVVSEEPEQVGLLVSRKVYAEDVFVRGAPGDGIRFISVDKDREAPYFCSLRSVWSKQNGRDGIRVTNNCNANTFDNCQFDTNGAHGFHQVIEESDQPAVAYNNRLSGGQCSYNQNHGIFIENGAHAEVIGTYLEFNSQVDGGNPKTGAYKNLQLGPAVTRCFIVLGELGTDVEIEATVGINTVASNYVRVGGTVISAESGLTLGYENVGSGRTVTFNGAPGCEHQIRFREGATDVFALRYDGTPASPGNRLLLEAVNGGSRIEVLRLLNDGRLGWFGATPTAKPTVSGSRADGTALESLLAALAALGLVTDSTTA